MQTRGKDYGVLSFDKPPQNCAPHRFGDPVAQDDTSCCSNEGYNSKIYMILKTMIEVADILVGSCDGVVCHIAAGEDFGDLCFDEVRCQLGFHMHLKAVQPAIKI